MFPLFRIVSENLFSLKRGEQFVAYNKIETEVLTYLEPIAKDASVNIWDIEFKKEGPDHVLRIYLDKEGGISINDCETVSRAIEAVLDEKDIISQAYLLEVSSAGLDRLIKYDWHFKACLLKSVDVKLFAPIDGVKEFTAILKDYDGECVTFLDGDDTKIISSDKISSIRLTVEF